MGLEVQAAGGRGARRLFTPGRLLIGVVVLALVAAFVSWQTSPRAVAGASALAGKTVAQVSTGASHSCAVTTDGLLACWGLNTNGQLGDGTVTQRTLPTLVVTAATPLAGKQIASVSTGASHTCAVSTDGVLACWGLQTTGRLGNGVTTAANITLPVAVTTTGTPLAGKQIASVSTGTAHTCAISTDGVLACWGSNGNGRLGDGTTTNRSTPRAVTVAGTPLAVGVIDEVSAGANHTCATTTTGSIACWGLNTNGQVGDGTTTQRTVPTALAVTGTPLAGAVVASVSAGTSYACAITDLGVAACWGLQTNGRLGNNLTAAANVTVPGAVLVAGTPLAGKQVAQIRTGATHACAIATDGTTACWGNNGAGRLGDGTTTSRAVPTALNVTNTILGGKTVAQIRPGGAHTCAVTTDGVASCWGTNTNGQLGDGTTTNRTRAVAVITQPTLGVASVAGQRPGVTGYARPGEVVTLSGSWWTPSITAGGFSATVGGAPAASSLASDGTGALSGTVTVPGSATAGPATIAVTQGGDVVSTPITVLDTRAAAITPGGGPAGTTVSVTAQEFDPLAAVEIVGVSNLTGPILSTDAAVPATISADGSLSATPYTVTDAATTAILVRETAPGGDPAADTASAAFSVDPITVQVTSITGQRTGVLAFARAGDTLNVTGVGWPANLSGGALVASLCDTVGANCEAAVAGASLSTDGAGSLLGTVPIPPGSAAGERTVRVENAGRTALYGITILGDRDVTLVPVSGGAGTTVVVTGVDFDPDAALSIQGVRAADGSVASSDPATPTTATGSGTIAPINYTINDPLTVGVLVAEVAPDGDPAVDRAFGDFTVIPSTASITDIAGQRPGVTTYARSGDVLTIVGEFWAPALGAADITASLCTADGTTCEPNATDTLSTDAGGQLSGTVTAPAGAASGARAVKIVSTTNQVVVPVTVLGTRVVTTSSPTVDQGSSATVSGSSFDPTAAITVRGASSVAGPVTFTSDGPVSTVVGADGTFTGIGFTPNDPTTRFVVVTEDAPSGDPDVDAASASLTILLPVVAVIDSVTGQPAGVDSHARAGDELVVSGNGWAPNATASDLTAELCASDGTACDAPAVDTLVTDAGGVLSGTVTVPVAATVGPRSLKVSSINGESLTPVTVIGPRVVTLASSSVTVGGFASVSATGFDSGASLVIRGATNVSGPTVVYSTDAGVPVTADVDGVLSATSYTIDDAATVAIVVAEQAPGDPATDLAFASVDVVVPTYSLGLRAFTAGANPDPITVALGSIESPKAPTLLPGNLNRFEVIDDRNGLYGWTLSATMSDFVGDAGGSLDSAALVASPTCTAAPGAAPGATAGDSNQNFSGTVLLCTKDAQVGAGGSTSGIYTIDTTLQLTVPAFQRADNYVAIVTVMLV